MISLQLTLAFAIIMTPFLTIIPIQPAHADSLIYSRQFTTGSIGLGSVPGGNILFQPMPDSALNHVVTKIELGFQCTSEVTISYGIVGVVTGVGQATITTLFNTQEITLQGSGNLESYNLTLSEPLILSPLVDNERYAFYLNFTSGCTDTGQQFLFVSSSQIADSIGSELVYSYSPFEPAYIGTIGGQLDAITLDVRVFGESLPSTKDPSTIDIELESHSIKFGEDVTTSGTINPPHSADVTITITKPDFSAFTEVVQSSSDGSYEFILTPDMPGLWSMHSSWEGDSHHSGSSSSTLSLQVYTKNVAYIPVKYIDGSLTAPTPLLSYVIDNVKQVEQYFFQQSYGKEVIRSEFIFDEWEPLPFPLQYYASLCPKDPSLKCSDFELDNNGDELCTAETGESARVREDAIRLAEASGFDRSDYDAIVVIQPKFLRSYACFDSHAVFTTAAMIDPPNDERLFEAYGLYAHELGHVLYRWSDYYGEARRDLGLSDGALATTGDIRLWGLMGDINGGQDAASPIDSFHKNAQGWISFDEIELNEKVELKLISEMNPADGDQIIKHRPLPFTQLIIEGRSPVDGVERDLDSGAKSLDSPTCSDDTCIIPETGAEIFLLRQIGAITDLSSLAPTSSSDLCRGTSENFRITITPGETFCDLWLAREVSLTEEDGKMFVEIEPIGISGKTIIVLEGLGITIPGFPSDSLLAENLPEADLHVISEGKHIGMNYDTREYEYGFEKAEGSGNRFGSGEWIALPNGTEMSAYLDSSPIELWAEANNVDTEEIQANATIIVIKYDSDGNPLESEPLEVQVSLDEITEIPLEDLLTNNIPKAKDDTAQTQMNSLVDIDILANDVDEDGDTLTVISSTLPLNGDVLDNGDGTLRYTPKAEFVGEDTFDYTISDGRGGNDSATVTITVNEISRSTGGGGGGAGFIGSLNVQSTTFPESYFLANPLARIMILGTSFFNAQGTSILQASTAQQIEIRSILQNQQQDSQNFAYITQVADESGVVIDLGTQYGSVGAGESTTFGNSWNVALPKEYTIKVFIWEDSNGVPIPLSSVSERTILVNPS